MLFTSHLLAGAIIARAVRRPLPALLVGVASHVAMDVVPHWGDPDHTVFLEVARVDGLVALAVAGTVLAASPHSLRTTVAAGMVGAGLLDLDKPCRELLGRSPFPDSVDLFHASIQREAAHRLPAEVAAALVLLAAALTAVRQPAPILAT